MKSVTALARTVRDRQEVRARRRIRLPATGPGGSATPEVYVLVPDDDVPRGGIRVMYRHVDLLNEAGISASVLHQRPGFRCTWFAHETRVRDVGSVVLGPSDLLVLGELDIDLVVDRGFRGPHAILNQSGYLTWHRGLAKVSEHYSHGPGLRGVVVVSENISQLLGHAFPSLTVRRVRPSIDPMRFTPTTRPLLRRISYMPRRGARNAEVVLEMLRSRGVIDGWETVPISGVSHDEVGAELQRSDVYLALSAHEGFGLPAAEAMACGNYVVGYHGYGGREFFRPDSSAVVETGDLQAVAARVESAIVRETQEPGWIRARGLSASQHVRAAYAPDLERADVVSAYGQLLGTSDVSGDRDRQPRTVNVSGPGS